MNYLTSQLIQQENRGTPVKMGSKYDCVHPWTPEIDPAYSALSNTPGLTHLLSYSAI